MDIISHRVKSVQKTNRTCKDKNQLLLLKPSRRPIGDSWLPGALYCPPHLQIHVDGKLIPTRRPTWAPGVSRPFPLIQHRPLSHQHQIAPLFHDLTVEKKKLNGLVEVYARVLTTVNNMYSHLRFMKGLTFHELKCYQNYPQGFSWEI